MVVFNDLEVDVERAYGTVVNLRENGRFLDFTLNMGLPSWRLRSMVLSSRSRLSCRRAKTSCIAPFAHPATADGSVCGSDP